MNITEEISSAFALIDTLNESITQGEYNEFSDQQVFFSKKMKQLLTDASQEELISVMPQLKEIQKKLAAIQLKAAELQASLKKESLTLTRTKKRTKAYK